MAFEGLSSRLQEITKKIKGEARITESNMKEMLREVKLALLEADVNYKIVKAFNTPTEMRVFAWVKADGDDKKKGKWHSIICKGKSLKKCMFNDIILSTEGMCKGD